MEEAHKPDLQSKAALERYIRRIESEAKKECAELGLTDKLWMLLVSAEFKELYRKSMSAHDSNRHNFASGMTHK